MHLANVLVQNIGDYGVNVANVDEMLACKVELLLVVFFQSELWRGEMVNSGAKEQLGIGLQCSLLNADT